MTADELATAVGTEAANELTSALAKIKHCLNQLTANRFGGAPTRSSTASAT